MLGTGTLGTYMINSNTDISKFVENVVVDEEDSIPQERASNTFLNGLKDIPSAIRLKCYEDSTGPLPLAGEFLKQSMYEWMHGWMDVCKFYVWMLRIDGYIKCMYVFVSMYVY